MQKLGMSVLFAALAIACSSSSSNATSGGSQQADCVDEATADTLRGDCTGLARMCEDLPPGGSECEIQPGCHTLYGHDNDTSIDDDCVGAPNKCTDLTDWRSCGKQLGCTWVLLDRASGGSAPGDNTLHLCPKGGTAPTQGAPPPPAPPGPHANPPPPPPAPAPPGPSKDGG
jgi:hypothetical protein